MTSSRARHTTRAHCVRRFVLVGAWVERGALPATHRSPPCPGAVELMIPEDAAFARQSTPPRRTRPTAPLGGGALRAPFAPNLAQRRMPSTVGFGSLMVTTATEWARSIGQFRVVWYSSDGTSSYDVSPPHAFVRHHRYHLGSSKSSRSAPGTRSVVARGRTSGGSPRRPEPGFRSPAGDPAARTAAPGSGLAVWWIRRGRRPALRVAKLARRSPLHLCL